MMKQMIILRIKNKNLILALMILYIEAYIKIKILFIIYNLVDL